MKNKQDNLLDKLLKMKNLNKDGLNNLINLVNQLEKNSKENK